MNTLVVGITIIALHAAVAVASQSGGTPKGAPSKSPPTSAPSATPKSPPTSAPSATPTVAAPTAREADEHLAHWLERQGLDRMLAGLLLERMTRETGDLDRRDAAERLRDVVLRQLRQGDLDADGARAVAEKLRPLLPSVDADELAIEIVRSRQRRMEQRLEVLRQGQQSVDAARELNDAMAELANEIDRLRRRLEIDLQNDDRRLDRSVGLEAESLLETVDRKRAILETARFAQAWTLLHSAMLGRSSLAEAKGDGWRPRATAALDLFKVLLDTGAIEPTPDDVSVDRRGDDLYASTMLGTALAKLLLEGTAKADPWFALMADPRTASSLRRSAPGWKLAGLVLIRDFTTARSWLDQLLSRGVVPASWIQFAIIECRASAVLALPGAAEFVQSALSALAAQEDLAAVLSLAEQLPATALPSKGFLAGYLRGMRGYSDARSMPADAPEASRRDAFRGAASALRGALGEADAGTSALSQGAARQLAGWCLVGAGDYDEASAMFEQAAESLPASRAAESLWLAAESADRAAAARTGADRAAFEAARRRIIDRLVERHPESAFAIRAEVQRIRQDPKADDESLARLRAIPRGSPAWSEALAAAEQLLYQRVRSGSETERRKAAVDYLELARAEDAPDAVTRRTWLRRRAEVALVPGVDRVDDALSAVTAIRAKAAAGEFEIQDIEPELRLRDLQIAARQARIDEAMELLATFEGTTASIGATTTFVRLARRSILRAAQAVESDQARAATIDVGAALIMDESTTLEPAAMHAAAMAVGRAAVALKSDDGNRRVRAALEALALARAKRPNDLVLLQFTAQLADRMHDDTLALNCFRSILSGTTLGEPSWFEARVGQVRVLARVDPPQARRVLEQHRALIPEWGPDPWGPALRSLDRSVP